jgi:hypothetical protein
LLLKPETVTREVAASYFGAIARSNCLTAMALESVNAFAKTARCANRPGPTALRHVGRGVERVQRVDVDVVDVRREDDDRAGEQLARLDA